MPSNEVRINGSWRIYYVGDSKMEELLAWLDKHGHLEGGEFESTKDDYKTESAK